MHRRLDALLLLDKPLGISSNAALQAARRLYRADKAGHAGTLDPLACGLLQVLFGEATKFAHWQLEADKEYLASVRLGVTTATGDGEGEVLERRPVAVSEAQIAASLARFRGEIEQVPPMYSALKRAGTPLYALARRGKQVERAPRRVLIRSLEMLGRDGALLELRITCSKGTYIRTLAEDIGAALGTGAHLAGLRRLAVGGCSVSDALTLDELEGMAPEAREARLLPVDRLVAALPAVALDASLAARFGHGQPVAVGEKIFGGPRRAYGPQGRFLGVGKPGAAGTLRPLRLMAHAVSPAQAAKH